MSAKVRDVMTRRVVAVREEASFKEIIEALRRFQVSACPVVDDSGRVIGLVSEADLLCKLADPEMPVGLVRLNWRLGEQTKATAVTAGRLMTAPAICVGPEAHVGQAARIMREKQVKRLPVTDADGRLIGVVSRCDVLSLFDRPDSYIAEEVAKLIADDTTLDAAQLDVTIGSGVVTVSGAVPDTEVALRLVARLRHADGVVAVRDRLSYPTAAERG
jgi:CBS domain-containing protein